MIGPRAIAWWAARTQIERVDVAGLEHVPVAGPVLLAARHYHHLLDGAVLIRAVPRPVHVVVALDWAASGIQRAVMERACAWAGWPVILRPPPAGSASADGETARYVRRGLRHAARLLRDGRVVAVFPEGRPVVDPATADAPPRDADGFLPFARGLTTIARLAEHEGARGIALVPVGFRYERARSRWRIAARFGAAMPSDAPASAVEAAVRALSR
jgi:putative membrane protein